MNLVPQKIDEILSVVDITEDFKEETGLEIWEPILEIMFKGHCDGHPVTTNLVIQSESGWKETKEKGYVLV